LTPENLVLLLNEYLTAMTDIILENDGIVDKYEGDLIMAEFGAPIQYDDHAARCCRASLRMQVRLKEMRVKWREEGIFPPLYSRVGVNSGDMIVGNMGSQQVFDYTVMGDAVNLSSRLEGANKGYETTIIIGHETWKDVKDLFVTRALDLLQVKGKTEPVKVYELLAESRDQLTDSKLRVLDLFAEGLELYRNKKFSEAVAYFHQSLVLEPYDGPSKTYLKRCEMYIADPPSPDWDGVWELTEK
jgi:adenylate cyclase